MSEPWNQPSFEQLLNDDSLVFGDSDWLTDAIDWDAQYPLAPEEPTQANQDHAHQAEKQSPPKWQCSQPLSPNISSSASLPMSTISAFPVVSQSSGLAPAPEVQHHKQIPKEKKFCCSEPSFRSEYVRKGDLARHKREERSDAEYLCPYDYCLWNRKGHGFKRMHRLASDLLTSNTSRYHPYALSRLDARYIAVDYNDSLASEDLLSWSSELHDTLENEIVTLDDMGRRCNGLSKYLDRLLGVHCPQVGCPVFCLSSTSLRYATIGLERHLQREHAFDRSQSWKMAAEAVKEQREAVGL